MLVHFSHQTLMCRPVRTDSPNADLYTHNPRLAPCNILKYKQKKVEERVTHRAYFHLTKTRFQFMIDSVPGFTERLAKQDEDGFRALIRSEIERERVGERKDNRASGKAGLL